MSDLIIQAYKVLQELKNETSYVQMQKLNEEMNIQYKIEIENFQTQKNAFYNIMENGGSYHPDFKTVSQKFQEAKKQLYEKDLVKQYFEAEKTFENILNIFVDQLTKSVSSYIESNNNKVSFQTKGGKCHVR
jgi:cell fate (sporulation/competence/biofilm development) regulator YlbF (YheA/YmcA/DUF963 family)